MDKELDDFRMRIHEVYVSVNDEGEVMELDEITAQAIIDSRDEIQRASHQYAEGAITMEELGNFIAVQFYAVITSMIERQQR